MELNVLKGCKNILQKYKPILYLEICDSHLKKHGTSIMDIQNLLQQYGYHFFRNFSGEEYKLCRLCSLSQGSKFYNLLAIHPLNQRYPKKNSSWQRAVCQAVSEKIKIFYNNLRAKYKIRTRLRKAVSKILLRLKRGLKR